MERSSDQWELSGSALFHGSVKAIGLVIPVTLSVIASRASPSAMPLSGQPRAAGQPAIGADELSEPGRGHVF